MAIALLIPDPLFEKNPKYKRYLAIKMSFQMKIRFLKLIKPFIYAAQNFKYQSIK